MNLTVLSLAAALLCAAALWYSRRTVARQRKRIRELLDRQAAVTKAADKLKTHLASRQERAKEAEREEREIMEADDDDLADRANALFPGLRDDKSGS